MDIATFDPPAIHKWRRGWRLSSEVGWRQQPKFEKTTLRVSNSLEDFTEDRQDDAETNRKIGSAVGRVSVRGLLSDIRRKTAEAIALGQGWAPRTLQRFLESIKWDEEKLRDRCQQIVAEDHAHPRAIGSIDESGTAKSGKHTAAVGRQWLGSRGKVDNGVVAVHLSYSKPGFQCLLDSRAYLPEEWANDPERRKKTTYPTMSFFKPNLKSHSTW